MLLACQEVSDCEGLYHVMMWMCVDCTCVSAASLDEPVSSLSLKYSYLLD